MSASLAIPAGAARIQRLADAWGAGAPSDRAWYDDSLRSWLRAVATSPHTSRSYMRTVSAFFQWCEATGRPALPHRITTSDIEAWVAFLEGGGRTLPPLNEDEAVAVRLAEQGGVTAAELADALSRRSLLLRVAPAEAHARLGALVRKHALVGDADGRFRLPPARTRPPTVTTVGQRLAALESLFRTIIGQNGQRAGLSTRGPMTVSPVVPVLERYTKRVASTRVVRGEARKTRPADWGALREACWGRDLPPGFLQRDWTILVCLATTGLRVSELCRVTLGDLEREGDVTRVTVTRKGGALDRLVVPQVALAEIDRLTPNRAASPRMPAACRAVRRWGNQAHLPADQPISADQVRAIFRGLVPLVAALVGGDREAVAKRIHPHGLRHLYAETLATAGVPVHEIRTLLGHASIATTDGYLPRAGTRPTDHSASLSALDRPPSPSAESAKPDLTA
jgi:integrase